jgi:protein-disulfide isomerase
MIKMLVRAGPPLAMALCVTHATFAQSQAAAPQTPMTQQQIPASSQMTPQQINEEMLKELKAIHQLLERLTRPDQAAPPATARLTDLKGFALGRPDAPLTIVEFTDLQCPFCRQYLMTAFPELKRNWIDTGRLRYISRDFPLDFHPQAMNAARAARCSGEQGRFWDMRFTLLTNAAALSPDFIMRTGTDLKLDAKAFAECTASHKYDAEIAADESDGVKIGVSGTPTFVLGRTAGSTLEGPMIVGAVPYATFDAKLKELLSK